MGAFATLKLYVLTAIVLASSAGCALHYYDPATATEHLWGIGHMAMRVGVPNEGLKTLGYRTDVVGFSIGCGDRETFLGCGWNARQQIEILDENTSVWLSWPEGSFYKFRAGSQFPLMKYDSAFSKAKEGES
jgi:hypothetical protein